jgi:hypothetical protein
MSHLTRVLLLILLLLCTLSSPAALVVHKDAKELRDSCREVVAIIDIPPGHATVGGGIEGGICLGFIQGVVDGFAVAAGRGWEVPTSLKACVPEKASTDELIRVFLKYIDGHPENLSYAAADVVWQAMIASYPCPAK